MSPRWRPARGRQATDGWAAGGWPTGEAPVLVDVLVLFQNTRAELMKVTFHPFGPAENQLSSNFIKFHQISSNSVLMKVAFFATVTQKHKFHQGKFHQISSFRFLVSVRNTFIVLKSFLQKSKT